MSFTFFVVVLNMFMWILTLVMTPILNYELNTKVFLGPNIHILNDWGAKNPYKI